MDAIPPQDLACERMVLGSMLFTPSLIPYTMSRLSSDCLWATQNRKIFICIAEMFKKGVPVDVLTLADELKKKEWLDDIGAEPYLSELLTVTATTENLSYHCGLLVEKAKLRRILGIISQIKNCAQNEEPVELIVQKIEALNKCLFNQNSLWHPAESRVLITKLLSTEPAPFDFIIPALLPKGICGFIFGEGGAYKSLSALWLCIQRAAGFVANSKWLDRFDIYGAGKSMFCSVEDQEIDIHHRIKAIVDRFSEMRQDVSKESIVDAISENFHVFPRERWMSDGCEHLIDADGNSSLKTGLISQYAKEQSVDLIILDTLSRLSLIDENDNTAGARLVSVLERIRDDTGATVLVIAHTGKTGRTAKTDTFGQNGMRGASALMDNARFGLWFRSLSSKNGPPKLEILNAKTFRTRRIEPFKVIVDYPAFTLFTEQEANDDDFMPIVIEDIKAHPGTTQRQTRGRLKKKTAIIKRAFQDALEEELIIYIGKGKGYKIHE